jgi:rhodanese-related sulfurtransferase
MNLKNFPSGAFIILLSGLISGHVSGRPASHGSPHAEQVKSSEIQFMTAEELKTKVTKNQPVTIIDVRASEAFADSNRKIKGAIHVKLRRLRYRLAFAPLNSVARDSEVVIYCACPNDELSIQAAQVLMDSGFKRVRALKGGWRAWLKLKGPVESASKGI